MYELCMYVATSCVHKSILSFSDIKLSYLSVCIHTHDKPQKCQNTFIVNFIFLLNEIPDGLFKYSHMLNTYVHIS